MFDLQTQFGDCLFWNVRDNRDVRMTDVRGGVGGWGADVAVAEARSLMCLVVLMRKTPRDNFGGEQGKWIHDVRERHRDLDWKRVWGSHRCWSSENVRVTQERVRRECILKGNERMMMIRRRDGETEMRYVRNCLNFGEEQMGDVWEKQKLSVAGLRTNLIRITYE